MEREPSLLHGFSGPCYRPLPQSASEGTFSAAGILPTLPLLPARSSTPQDLVQSLARGLRRQTIDLCQVVRWLHSLSR